MGENIAYGCLYCRSGSERVIAGYINEHFDDVSAVVPQKIRKHYHDGKCTRMKVLFMQGYVFIRADAEYNHKKLELVPNVHKLLKYDGKDWHLAGFDREFAEFFFEHGLIEYSRAEFIGGRIHFLDGFMKGHDDAVVRLNKRMKTAEVRLDITSTTIWVGYELI